MYDKFSEILTKKSVETTIISLGQLPKKKTELNIEHQALRVMIWHHIIYIREVILSWLGDDDWILGGATRISKCSPGVKINSLQNTFPYNLHTYSF